MIVTEDRLQKALHYLATTDEPVAKAKALMKGLEKQEKTIKAQEFISQKGRGGVAEREHAAYASEAYNLWLKMYEEAILDYELLDSKRNTEALIVEVWRSLNSARTKGVL